MKSALVCNFDGIKNGKRIDTNFTGKKETFQLSQNGVWVFLFVLEPFPSESFFFFWKIVFCRCLPIVQGSPSLKAFPTHIKITRFPSILYKSNFYYQNIWCSSNQNTMQFVRKYNVHNLNTQPPILFQNSSEYKKCNKTAEQN